MTGDVQYPGDGPESAETTQSHNSHNNMEDISQDLIRLIDMPNLPLPVGSFLPVAIECARALAELHSTRQIHWHINTRNLLWDAHNQRVYLSAPAGSGMEQSGAVLPGYSRVEKTDWAYMSPEQTGRMNRAIDYRTDMYSLGVVFYELLTGHLPFQAANLMEWVHFHIARAPRPPHELTPGIPPVVSAMVLKLMDKAAENRYQNARGLQYDLEKCWNQHQSIGRIDPFGLGESDQSDRLRIAQRLYGRSNDTQVLSNAFRRVCQGQREVLLVSGYAGIGKTSLVHELYQPAIAAGGIFAEGKFDYLKRNTPYSGILMAFSELSRLLLMSDAASLKNWKNRLLEAMKNNAGVIIDVVPEIELIVGPQPEVPPLGPEETRNRFNMIVQSFIKVFAEKEHPLVLFLDDLHAADQASLKMLSSLLADPASQHLLIIGVYRENEVDEFHPLRTAIKDMQKADVPISNIQLKPLNHDHINEMIADMLGCNREETVSLTNLLMVNTMGNPFFVNQMIQRIYEQKLLRFDGLTSKWIWDSGAIQSLGFSDNVIELLTLKINDLNPDTRRLLAIASCIGTVFDAETLSAISALPITTTIEKLEEAAREGLLSHIRNFYGMAGDDNGTRDVSYAFFHDQVLEACSLMLDPQKSEEIHYRLGRTMMDSTPRESLKDRVFDIVNHLNRSSALISDFDERMDLLVLNLMAGQKAKASTAYDQAVAYLHAGVDLLPEHSWENHYDMTFSLYKELSESEYLAGNHNQAEHLFDMILQNAHSLLDRAEIYNIRIILYATIGQFVKNNSLGIEALTMLGDSYPDINDQDSIIKAFIDEYEIYKVLIWDRSIPDLINLPPLVDPIMLIRTKITMNMLSSAYMSNPTLLALLGAKSINMILEFGISPYSTYSIAVWGLLLGARFRNYEAGYEFGRLSLDFNRRFNHPATRSNIPFVFGNFINHWQRPMAENIPYLYEGIEGGLEVGDFAYASYSGTALTRLMLSYGHHSLYQLLEETDKTLGFFKKINNQASLALQELIRSVAYNLMGESHDNLSLNTDDFNEESHLQLMEEIRFGTGIALYYLYKAMCLFTYGHFDNALPMSEQAMKNRAFIVNSTQDFDTVFWHALCCCACYPYEDPPARLDYDSKIGDDLKLLENWTTHCPDNFHHKTAIIQAEQAWQSQLPLEAEKLFEEAMISARENGFIQGEALAASRAAAFYKARGFQTIADAYTNIARSSYSRWGARGVAQHIENSWTGLSLTHPAEQDMNIETSVGQLDAVAVVKASQAISSQILTSRLMEILMQTVIESAGAQRGCLVSFKGEEVNIVARAELGRDGLRVEGGVDVSAAITLPETMINYVRHTGEAVILDNAAQKNRFIKDPYFAGLKTRSVLCLPVMRQSALVGVLYLENNLVSGAFTSDRVAVLELLASQAAISLENASLYEERASMEEELRLLNQKLNNIIEFLPDATIVIDRKGKVIAWNRAAEEMTGVSKKEVLGGGNLEYSTALYGLQRPMLIDLIDVPNEELEKTYAYVNRNGEVLMAEMYIPRLYEGRGAYAMGVAAPLRDADGNIIGAIESIRDITEPRKTMDERDRLRHLLSNIIDSMPSILVGTDQDGMVTQWNAEAARQTGLGEEQALGKPIDIVLPLFGKQLARLQQALSQHTVQKGDLVTTMYDGDVHYSEVMIYPLVANQVEGAVVRVDDVTEKVRLQEMMIQTEKMMSVGGLAAGMAHEINNPLSGILQSTQNIMNRLSPELQKNVAAAEECGTSLEAIRAYMTSRNILDFLDGIKSSGIRAANIISNMLQFSRRSESHKTPILMSTLLDRSIELAASDYDLKRGFDFRHIRIIREYDPGLDEVYCSHTEIEQVILNLLKNSAHALSEVSMEKSDPQITLRCYREDGMAVVEVEDNGPGIDESVKKHIFEPFFTTKSPGLGTGLGLSVSYFIVTSNHQGQMYVDSQVGEGTRVTLRIPIIPVAY